MIETPESVEATRRSAGEDSYLFLLNHGDREVVVELDGSRRTDLLAGADIDGQITLEPLGAAVLRPA